LPTVISPTLAGNTIWRDTSEVKSSEIRGLFDEVVAAIRDVDPVRVLPEETRIAFQVRMSFAQITPKSRWLDGHVVLARRLEHPRFRRIETISPRNHLHSFRLTTRSEVAGEFRSWLAEAYKVGDQRHLERKVRDMASGRDTTGA
jgi:hypothetical protein